MRLGHHNQSARENVQRGPERTRLLSPWREVEPAAAQAEGPRGLAGLAQNCPCPPSPVLVPPAPLLPGALPCTFQETECVRQLLYSKTPQSLLLLCQMLGKKETKHVNFPS